MYKIQCRIISCILDSKLEQNLHVTITKKDMTDASYVMHGLTSQQLVPQKSRFPSKTNLGTRNLWSSEAINLTWRLLLADTCSMLHSRQYFSNEVIFPAHSITRRPTLSKGVQNRSTLLTSLDMVPKLYSVHAKRNGQLEKRSRDGRRHLTS